MNRGRLRWLGGAIIAAACAAPVQAGDPPRPSLALDPVTARSLLAPLDGPGQASSWRLDPGLDPASGQRARLSLEVGDSTLFAITGRLNRRPGPPGPLDAGHAKALGLGRGDSGKVYGAGIARSVRGVDVSATYQYSKLSAEPPGGELQAGDGGPGRSHSLCATARIRFKP